MEAGGSSVTTFSSGGSGLWRFILLARQRPWLLRDRRRRLVHRSGRALVDAGVEPVARHRRNARGNGVAVTAGKSFRSHRAALLRQRQDRCDPCSFGRAHGACIMSEIPVGACIHAIGADAGLREVQIDLHDPPLAPQMLDEEREPGFRALAGIAAAIPQEGVLRRLLADRRSAADSPARSIAFHRILNGFEVEAVMRAELAVLGRDRRTDHVAVGLADRHPVLVRTAAGDHVAEHVEGDRRVHEAIGEHPQDRDQEEGEDQLDDPAEEAAEERAAPAALVLRNRRFGALAMTIA